MKGFPQPRHQKIILLHFQKKTLDSSPHAPLVVLTKSFNILWLHAPTVAADSCCWRARDEIRREFHKETSPGYASTLEINTHIKPKEKEEEEVCTHVLGIIVAAGDVVAAHDASLMLPTLLLPFQEVDLLEQLLLMELELPHSLLFVYSCFFSSSPFSCSSPLSAIYSPPLISRSTTLLILPTPLVDAELCTLPAQRKLHKSRTPSQTLTLTLILKSWRPLHGLALCTIFWPLQMKRCSHDLQ